MTTPNLNDYRYFEEMDSYNNWEEYYRSFYADKIEKLIEEEG